MSVEAKSASLKLFNIQDVVLYWAESIEQAVAAYYRDNEPHSDLWPTQAQCIEEEDGPLDHKGSFTFDGVTKTVKEWAEDAKPGYWGISN